MSHTANDMKDMCTELNLTQIITEPTQPNMKILSHSSLLDLILTNKPHHYAHSCVFPIEFSYHCPVDYIRNSKLNRPGHSISAIALLIYLLNRHFCMTYIPAISLLLRSSQILNWHLNVFCLFLTL